VLILKSFQLGTDISDQMPVSIQQFALTQINRN
jgi:hypothetical protein